MKLYFVESATGDNYIMAVTSEGVLCDSCAPTGKFAGVSLYSYGSDGNRIDGETIAAMIAEAVDPEIGETDLGWMGEPWYSSLKEWESENEAFEIWQRDTLYLIGEYDV